MGALPSLSYLAYSLAPHPYPLDFSLPVCSWRKGNIDPGVGDDVLKLSPENLQKPQATNRPDPTSASFIPPHHEKVQNPCGFLPQLQGECPVTALWEYAALLALGPVYYIFSSFLKLLSAVPPCVAEPHLLTVAQGQQ